MSFIRAPGPTVRLLLCLALSGCVGQVGNIGERREPGSSDGTEPQPLEANGGAADAGPAASSSDASAPRDGAIATDASSGQTKTDASRPDTGTGSTSGDAGPVDAGAPRRDAAVAPADASTPRVDAGSVASVPWRTRVDYHQVLEPKGDIVLAAVGQENFPAPAVDLGFYSDFVNAVGVNPSTIMLYHSISYSPSAMDTWASGVISQLNQLSSSELIVLQIGLDLLNENVFTGPGSAVPPIDVQVGNTTQYDASIDGFCAALRKIGRPAFVRIGHEFNGPWNGYQADTYVKTFRKIANKIRNKACGVPVATVWDFSLDAGNRFEPYYPGDSYVDWFGINFFDAGQFTNSVGGEFIKAAEAAGRPVMMGEATPRYSGAQSGWDGYFQGLFDYLYNTPTIKMFSYINWDWEVPAYGFPGWGNAKIPANSVIARNFQRELSNGRYILRQPSAALLSTLTIP